MKFNRFWENGKTFDSRIMMLSLILLWEKEWVEECLWALYRINRNDGFIGDNPKLGHITTLGTLSLRQPV
jgi:hypothetical protein